jgi:hypothetical protein
LLFLVRFFLIGVLPLALGVFAGPVDPAGTPPLLEEL